MAQILFADTWYFIAVYDRFDGHHARALRLRSLYGAARVVTHEIVLSEMLSYFSNEGARGREIGVQAARLMLRNIEVLTPTRPLFERSLDLYAARPDKEYSLVDCMSMLVMRDRGISHVLTNDHHFRQEGFTVLSDAP